MTTKMRTTAMIISGELQSLMNIPFISSTYDFLRHFALFFLLPIGVVVLSAVVAAAIVSRLHQALFSRYATPEELYDKALCLLKNNTSKDRQKALSNLHLVIQLKSEFIQAYIVLATELFYGELTNADNKYRDRRKQRRYGRPSLKQRRSRQIQSTKSSPLKECEQVIQQGLSVDPSNRSLLTLQSEVNLVKRYGTNSADFQMLNVGSFGYWRFGDEWR